MTTSEETKIISIIAEKLINNQAMLTIILKEIAAMKSKDCNKSKEQILNEFMNEVNKESDDIANSFKS